MKGAKTGRKKNTIKFRLLHQQARIFIVNQAGHMKSD